MSLDHYDSRPSCPDSDSPVPIWKLSSRSLRFVPGCFQLWYDLLLILLSTAHAPPSGLGLGSADLPSDIVVLYRTDEFPYEVLISSYSLA